MKMRNLMKIKEIAVFSLALALVSSCGGGGIVGGIDKSGEKPQMNVSASGPINGFGSVIVNGVRYNTDDAQVYIRGELSEETALDVGDYVVVVGEVDGEGDGVAKEVYYQPRVTGPIESLDVNLNRMEVMGHTIQLMEDTTYSSDILPRNIEGFQIGNRVTISGSADADDMIRASRIELNDLAPYEVLGAVESIDLIAQTFKVDQVTVDYSGVPGAASDLQEGKIVAVWGEELDGKTLQAFDINFDMDLRLLRGVDSIELTGFVRNLRQGGFDIDSLPITVTDDTEFVGGDRDSLEDNVKVRIDGELGPDTTLVATQVEILPTPNMQVYGVVQSVVPASWGSPFWGKVQVQDHEFWVKFDTRLTGDQEQRIGFMDLRIGDNVYVSGYSLDGNRYATSIAVDNREYEQFIYDIQGYVYAVTSEQNAFSIFNTRVVTNEDTVYSDGFNSYTRDEFFGILDNSDPNFYHYVQVRGWFDFEEGVMRVNRVIFMVPGMPPPPGA